MIWAEHYHRLEPPTLLSAQRHYSSLERGWQIVFGGVFEKRAWMLFPTKLCFVRDVHRRDGISKTVTKNIPRGRDRLWVGFFFKNPKPKERSKEALFRGSTITVETAERSFPSLNLKGIYGFLSVFFPRFTLLNLKQAFRTARMMNISGFAFGELSRLKQASSVQPDSCNKQPKKLKENPFPTVDDAPLTLQHADA